MPTIEFEPADVTQAEAFLAAALTEQFPDADFSPGSALRDHVIKPLAFAAAFFRGEAAKIVNASSLQRIFEIEDPDEQLSAAVALAVNWYVTPSSGDRVRGIVTVRFARQVAVSIPPSAVFTKFTGVRFRPDFDTTRVYAADALQPSTNEEGQVTDYALRVPVVAEFTGNAYAVTAGGFSGFSSFSPYVLSVENETAFVRVAPAENALSLVQRVPDAITNRNLTSRRSIAAVILEEFKYVNRVLVQGVGDDAMRRDIVSVSPDFASVHVGNHTDVYVGTELSEFQVTTAVVGVPSEDPSTRITRFADDSIDDLRRYVKEGDVLRIYNNDPSAPSLYLIEEVYGAYLRVAANQPFPFLGPSAARGGLEFNTSIISAPNEVYDPNADFTSLDVGKYIRIERSLVGNEGSYLITSVVGDTAFLDTAALVAEPAGDFAFRIFDDVVEYSIGSNNGVYDNSISRRSTGAFTNQVTVPGGILLPQVPLYLIREVEVINGSDPAADPATGRVRFPVRVNEHPVVQPDDSLQYQVKVVDPLVGGSNQQVAILQLGTGPEDTGVDGTMTLSGEFSAETASFTAEDVGKTLRVADAFYLANRGEFRVQTVVNTTTVVLQNVRDPSWVPAAERGLVWEISDLNRYDGFTARVVYDTLTGFEALAEYVQGPDNRDVAANTLLRAFHPVYVGFDLVYTVRTSAPELPDEDAIISELVAFINNFPVDDVLDVSDIVTAFQNTNPDIIGSVQLPLELSYVLYAPDGRAIPYGTTNAVELVAANSVAITESERLTDPVALSITDQTVRYLSDAALITLTQVSRP